jgi:hypothetical protein
MRDHIERMPSPMTLDSVPMFCIAMSLFLSCTGAPALDANDGGDFDSRGPSDALGETAILDVVEEPDLAACVADGPIGVPRDDCPIDLPDGGDCAMATPFYADVAPIFAARCSVCHQPGGLDVKFRFDSYPAIYNNRQTRIDIFTQIYNCRMPPSCAPNLSPSERKMMLEWFVCSAPNAPEAGAP